MKDLDIPCFVAIGLDSKDDSVLGNVDVMA